MEPWQDNNQQVGRLRVAIARWRRRRRCGWCGRCATNENTNGLLRQYFPKGHTMKHLTQNDLDDVAVKLNTRPRKRLGFDTPAARFNTLLR